MKLEHYSEITIELAGFSQLGCNITMIKCVVRIIQQVKHEISVPVYTDLYSCG